jgi:hypothetical protein
MGRLVGLLDDDGGDMQPRASPTAACLALTPTRPGVWPRRLPSPAPSAPWWPCWCSPAVEIPVTVSM